MAAPKDPNETIDLKKRNTLKGIAALAGKIATSGLSVPGELANLIIENPDRFPLSAEAENIARKGEALWMDAYNIFSWHTDIATKTAGVDLESTIEQRLGAILPPILDNIRQFQVLKSKILTADPAKNAQIVDALKQIAEKKKAFYLDHLHDIAALYDNDPRFQGAEFVEAKRMDSRQLAKLFPGDQRFAKNPPVLINYESLTPADTDHLNKRGYCVSNDKKVWLVSLGGIADV